MHGGIREILRLLIEIATKGIELLAVAIIIAGVAVGTIRFLLRRASNETYNEYKQVLDKALLLGLNILVAADIVRTVALDPTITNIAGLGLLVVVRTFLSWALFVELNERWPWQRSAGQGSQPR
jgi:uncharacterized membrane protein